MINLLKKIFNKQEIVSKNPCLDCVYFGEEEMYNKPFHKNEDKRYCSQLDKHMYKYHSCEHFSKELFEATENSTQTAELNLDWEIDLSKIEEDEVNPENESK